MIIWTRGKIKFWWCDIDGFVNWHVSTGYLKRIAMSSYLHIEKYFVNLVKSKTRQDWRYESKWIDCVSYFQLISKQTEYREEIPCTELKCTL